MSRTRISSGQVDRGRWLGLKGELEMGFDGMGTEHMVSIAGKVLSCRQQVPRCCSSSAHQCGVHAPAIEAVMGESPRGSMPVELHWKSTGDLRQCTMSAAVGYWGLLGDKSIPKDTCSALGTLCLL